MAGTIADLKEGSTGSIRTMLVQLFDTEQFYEVCPECGSRTRINDGKYTCKDHGDIQPEHTMVVSGVIDDGTDNIRAVFFRENACKLLGMSMETILSKRGHVFESVDIVGKEFILIGRARRNKMFDRLEYIVNDVQAVDLKQEIAKAINVFGSSI